MKETGTAHWNTQYGATKQWFYRSQREGIALATWGVQWRLHFGVLRRTILNAWYAPGLR
jgi:hypothetical protein